MENGAKGQENQTRVALAQGVITGHVDSITRAEGQRRGRAGGDCGLRGEKEPMALCPPGQHSIFHKGARLM